MKKNLFSLGIVLSIFFGITLSFNIQSIHAQEMNSEVAIPLGKDRIPCWSAANQSNGSTYVDCSTCERQRNAEPKGPQATCTVSF